MTFFGMSKRYKLAWWDDCTACAKDSGLNESDLLEAYDPRGDLPHDARSWE